MSDTSPPVLARLLGRAGAAPAAEAWEEFLEAYSRLLLHVARSLGGGHDAVMDRYAFVLDHLRRDDFHRLRAYSSDGRTRFTTWLVVVTRRLCHDHHRQRYGRPRGQSPAVEVRSIQRRQLADLAGAPEAMEQVPDDSAHPAVDALVRTEIRAALQHARDALPPRDRLLLRLRFDDGLPAPEIAKLMGFPSPFHVYRRLAVLTSRLRAALNEAGVDGPAS